MNLIAKKKEEDKHQLEILFLTAFVKNIRFHFEYQFRIGAYKKPTN